MVFDHTAPRLLTTRGFAYLKVAEGCNNPCTFCAIPIWRGRFRSRTIESLVDEAKQLEAAGITELNLIAQDTTRYGEDLGMPRHGLVRLVEALLAATNIPWIRFLYAYPTTLDEDLLRLMGSEERFCSYLDMPLQHSHGDILTAMRRGGDAKRYLRLLERARELAPDVFLRSTFIVGFPGETEADVDALRAFIGDHAFDHVGVFTYSHEEGTSAYQLADDVPARVKQKRRDALMTRQKRIVAAARKQGIGSEIAVMVDGPSPEHELVLQGRTEGQAPEIDAVVYLTDCDPGLFEPGELIRARIVEARDYDIVAAPIGVVADSRA